MQIVMLSGSRNREGRTARAMAAIGKGIEEAGGSSEIIFLPELSIERCRQCEKDGWGICQTEHRCIIDDGFSSIVAKLKAADAAVFATPVYFFDLSESLRSFLTGFAVSLRARSGYSAAPCSDAAGCIFGDAHYRCRSRYRCLFSRWRRTWRAVLLRPVGKNASGMRLRCG